MNVLKAGIISISIDGEPNSLQSDSRQSADATHALLVQLIDQFEHHRVPATWTFSDPANTSLVCRRIADLVPNREIALQLGRQQTGTAVSRTEITRSVITPLQRAAAAGLNISSLAVLGASIEPHIDLLAKHGITMLCGTDAPASTLRNTQKVHQFAGALQLLCYGLWHLPISQTVSGGNWFESIRRWAAVHRAIRQISQGHGGLCHIRIDAAAIARSSASSGIRAVDRLLHRLEKLRAAGRIEILNLRAIAERLIPKRSLAARSILRAA